MSHDLNHWKISDIIKDFIQHGNYSAHFMTMYNCWNYSHRLKNDNITCKTNDNDDDVASYALVEVFIDQLTLKQ